jgi:hypothetical protein
MVKARASDEDEDFDPADVQVHLHGAQAFASPGDLKTVMLPAELWSRLAAAARRKGHGSPLQGLARAIEEYERSD